MNAINNMHSKGGASSSAKLREYDLINELEWIKWQYEDPSNWSHIEFNNGTIKCENWTLHYIDKGPKLILKFKKIDLFINKKNLTDSFLNPELDPDFFIFELIDSETIINETETKKTKIIINKNKTIVLNEFSTYLESWLKIRFKNNKLYFWEDKSLDKTMKMSDISTNNGNCNGL